MENANVFLLGIYVWELDNQPIFILKSKTLSGSVAKLTLGELISSICPHADEMNDLNGKFIDIDVLSPNSNSYYDLCYVPVENPLSFRCVDQFEALKSFSSAKFLTLLTLWSHPIPIGSF